MRKLNKFIGINHDFRFGDYILFQEYCRTENGIYNVSKPILAIYLGFFIADQTIGFNYIRWNNDSRLIVNENGYKNIKEVGDVENHIEWNDCIDILGFWNNKPNYKEILTSYRKYNKESSINTNDIEW